MTTTALSTGSQTATISTEHTLDTITTAGVLLLSVDINAMVANDVMELRIYGKARTGDTERLLFKGSYGPIVSPLTLVQSTPIVSPHYTRFTLKQTAGTGRSYPWAIYAV